MFWRLETGYGENYFSHSNWQALEIQAIPLEPIIKFTSTRCLKLSSSLQEGERQSLGNHLCKCPASCLASHCKSVLGDSTSVVLMDILIPSL